MSTIYDTKFIFWGLIIIVQLCRMSALIDDLHQECMQKGGESRNCSRKIIAEFSFVIVMTLMMALSLIPFVFLFIDLYQKNVFHSILFVSIYGGVWVLFYLGMTNFISS